MQVVHLDAERLPTAGVVVGAEHGGDPSSIFAVPPQSLERTLAVRVLLHVVIRIESLPEIAGERSSHLRVVMNNTEKRSVAEL
jgi:hypothetical protein